MQAPGSPGADDCFDRATGRRPRSEMAIPEPPVGPDAGVVLCHGRERQRRPTLTIASTIHPLPPDARLQRIALVRSPRLVGAEWPPSRALASRALRSPGPATPR